MLKQTVVDEINKQIAREMYSSNLYLAMAGYYQLLNLTGFSHWMRIQAQEEMVHALKFFDYLLNRGGEAKIGQIAEPPVKWDSPLAAVEASFEHEKMISGCINDLADLAIKEGDHATHILLQWFVSEQVEEEANVSQIVERLKMMGDFKGGLFLMDNELKARTFTAGSSQANM